MDKLVDNFSKYLEEKIKQINNLKKEGSPIQTISKRVDLLLICMAKIEKSMNELLNFKESHKDINLKEVIQYDFDLSEYAERFYVQANKVREVWQKQMLLEGDPTAPNMWEKASTYIVKKGHKVGTPSPLFVRIDDKLLQTIREIFSVPYLSPPIQGSSNLESSVPQCRNWKAAHSSLRRT